MLSLTELSTFTPSAAGTAVTIGKFDAIHKGHQELFKAVANTAKERSMQSAVLTFDRHPDALLNPERFVLPLIGPNLKQALISSFGIDLLLTLNFNQALAELTPEEFVVQYLSKGLNAKVVFVGVDFRFGHRGSGNIETLRELGQRFGFEVNVISSEMLKGEKISTSSVREALDRGDVAKVSQMLGRTHTTVGLIEHGLKIGRTIGFPTANMARDCEGYLPLDGVYAGWLVVDGNKYPAAHSVGINETFQAVPRLVESHVLDRNDLDLYDKVVTLEFVDFIRPAAKFNGVDDLVEEINRDLDKIRIILGI